MVLSDQHRAVWALQGANRRKKLRPPSRRRQEMGLLKDGAMVVADNVLKPGAPYFLWRVTQRHGCLGNLDRLTVTKGCQEDF